MCSPLPAIVAEEAVRLLPDARHPIWGGAPVRHGNAPRKRSVIRTWEARKCATEGLFWDFA